MDTFARGNSEANMKIAKYKRQRVRDEHIDFALKSSQSPFEFEQSHSADAGAPHEASAF
jgi:hypothetical protein